MARLKPAVFLDRDGTLVEYIPYLSRPDQIRLLPGTVAAIRMLREAGYACVLVSNQSAVGRGIISADELALIQDELQRQLAAEGARLDAVYDCPLAPIGNDPTQIEFPDRKPGPGMLLRAARDLGLDLSRSWMIGDNVSDVLAGRNAGCGGVILLTSALGDEARISTVKYARADDILHAAEIVLGRRATTGKAL